MSRIGYAPGIFDMFQICHLKLLQEAKGQCDYLIAGVISDEVLAANARRAPVFPLVERLEIVRNIRCVDAAFPAMTGDMDNIWSVLRFDTLFQGIDGASAGNGNQLDRTFAAAGVKVVYLSEASSTSSDTVRRSPQQSEPTRRKGPSVDFTASKIPLWFE